jgi:holo-[acyl-carrier protein] synthase
MYKIGIDLVEVERIERVLARDRSVPENVFTDVELRYSQRKRYPFQRFAARFAAKEALFKALGTGLSGDLDWRDVEVRNERSGKPVIYLSGKTANTAHQMGVINSFLSISHTENYAIALVILVVRN